MFNFMPFRESSLETNLSYLQATWEDPWEELDPYATHKHMEKPFKKGKCCFAVDNILLRNRRTGIQ